MHLLLSDADAEQYRQAGHDAITMLAFELMFNDPGFADHLLEVTAGVLAGDGIMGDRWQAEAGQPSTTPNWYHAACEQLAQNGVSPDEVHDYMAEKIAALREATAQD